MYFQFQLWCWNETTNNIKQNHSEVPTIVEHFRCHVKKYKNMKNQPNLSNRGRRFSEEKFILILFQSFIHYDPPSYWIFPIRIYVQESRKEKREKQFIPFYENKVQVQSFMFLIELALNCFSFPTGRGI